MTKKEAAIVTIYTGIVCGKFSEAHKYAQQLLGRPIWTHEFADKKLADELKALAKADFLAIEVKP